MKTFAKFLTVLALLILTPFFNNLYAIKTMGVKKVSQQSFTPIKGKVVDSENGVPLIFASVTVEGTNISIVTNVDGEFTLKIGDDDISKSLEISFIGYQNKVIPINEMKQNGGKNIIEMETAPIPLNEIIVKPASPVKIVEEAIKNIHINYETVPNQMTAFYRETIKKNRNYVSIGEAVVEIFKAPYNNFIRFDGTRIYKGRKSSNVEKMDTILFKLQGGPVSVLQLDIVKNTESILTIDAMKYYDYTLRSVIEIDGKPHYVVDFMQKPSVETPLFMGTFFIDMNTFAISEVEFGFNLSNKEAASSIFIKKKPLGMTVTPEIASYRTKYHEQNGKWYFSYSRAEVKFKVNWDKKLFNTNYTTMAEIAVTDRTDEEVIKFAGKEKLRSSDIFSDEVSAFTDKDFWGDYNVIEPDQSIESAIRKLNRKLKFNDRRETE